MKVLLINPPSFQEILGNNPKVVEEERGYTPPLGLLYLAACLPEKDGFQVLVHDSQVEESSWDDIRKKVVDFAPSVVGLTAMTFTLLDVMSTVRLVREAAPEARIVIGGPHAHIYPRETMEALGADFVIQGEGEHSFRMLLEALESGSGLDSVPGLWYRDGASLKSGPQPEAIEDLDSLPFPDRRAVPYRKYSSILSSVSPVTTMFTSRGCPFRCTFCDRPHLGKRFRARSAESVVSEMKECQSLGIREILIYDDTFTVDRRRVLDVCRLYLEQGLSVGWDIRARVNTIDEETAYWLSRANCRRIHFGVEAGTEKILKTLNKGITLDEAEKAFKLARKYGMETLAYFMIGAPGETEDDIQASFRFARKLDPDYLHLTVLTPFPGTEVYRQGLEAKLFPDFWASFAARPDRAFTPLFWEEIISAERLKELVASGYKGFYFRPAYILKRLWRVRSSAELVKKAGAALKLFNWRQ
ncbi:MAG: radical SAM protein [Candidatus Wallbacteria bacterium]|nr:radical SAM protein [Candidatus Wallbacteria bacterium]